MTLAKGEMILEMKGTDGVAFKIRGCETGRNKLDIKTKRRLECLISIHGPKRLGGRKTEVCCIYSKGPGLRATEEGGKYDFGSC